MTSRRDVQWLDGLRGLASFTVVCTHVTRAFDDRLFFAADNLDVPPRLLQWPFIRLLFQGNVGVAIFAMLTGYVCALKPLRLARAGRQDEALSSIAKGAFRRVPRLVLPASIALAIAWTLAQLGGFTAASRSDSEWLRMATPAPSPSTSIELYRLWKSFFATWIGERTEYDDHQWTLFPLLKGSLMAYLLVAALVFTKFRYRIAIYLLFIGYWWQNYHPDTETFAQQVVWGVLLCDISQSSFCQQFFSDHQTVGLGIATFLVLMGLYFASFPKYWMSAPLATWSGSLLVLGEKIFPLDVDYARRFTALGVQLTTLGLQICPWLQQVLSNKLFLSLGRYSFAVYLIHGTLLRSLLVWALYGITGKPWEPKVGDDGQEVPPQWLPRRFHGVPFLLVTAIWLCCVYYCAYIWTAYVDNWCARLTQRIEDFCSADTHEKSIQLSQA